jgi:hypothetical protein
VSEMAIFRQLACQGSARRRDVFLKILEEARRKFDFVVWGYVVMPQYRSLKVDNC